MGWICRIIGGALPDDLNDDQVDDDDSSISSGGSIDDCVKN